MSPDVMCLNEILYHYTANPHFLRGDFRRCAFLTYLIFDVSVGGCAVICLCKATFLSVAGLIGRNRVDVC